MRRRGLLSLAFLAGLLLILFTPALRDGNGGRAAIGLMGMAYFGYFLVTGLRSGTMELPSAVPLEGHWRDSPISFWFCAVFNLVVFAGSVVLTIHFLFNP